MKKFLLSLALGALSAFGASATVAGFGVNGAGQDGADEYAAMEAGVIVDKTFTAGDISIVLTKINNSDSQVNGSQVRWYKGDVITVTPANGAKITGITVAASTAAYAEAVTFPADGTHAVDGTTATWTYAEGMDGAVELNNTAQVRFTYMWVEYSNGGATTTVAAPTIALEEVNGGYQVVMTAAEGADIYYSIDGETPTVESTKYAGPVDVWETTTFKAIAVKDGESSSVKTFVATVPLMLDDFSAIYGVEPSDIPSAGVEIAVNASMTVLYQSADNKYLYLSCGGQNALFYGGSEAYAPGSTLSNAKGTLKNYNGLLEVTDYTLGELTPGTLTIKPTEFETVEGIGANMQAHYLKLTGVSISDVNEKNGTITDAEGNTIALYNNLGIEVADAENVDVTGFVGVYKTTVQFMPCAIEEAGVAGEVAAPKFQYVYDNYSIRVKMTAEEGATIYFTKDGSEPTTASTKYTAPVSIGYSGTTFKAIAVKDGNASDVAEFDAKYYDDATEYGFGPVCSFADDEPRYYYFGLGNYGMYYVVAYQNGTSTYLYDVYSETYMLVEEELDVKVGDQIKDIFGVVVNTDGQPYMYDVTLTMAEGTAEVPEATFLSSLAELGDEDEVSINAFVAVKGVKVVKDGSSYKLVAADGAEVALVNKFNAEISEYGSAIVTGFVGSTSSDRVLYPTEVAEVVKDSPNLRWVNKQGEEVKAFLWVIGKSTVDNLPTVDGIFDADPELTSSNPEVAEIDTDIMGVKVNDVAGEATITITVPETENYAAGSASFVLTVMTEEQAKAVETTVIMSKTYSFGKDNKIQTWVSEDGYEFEAEVSLSGGTYPAVNGDDLRIYGSSANEIKVACPVGYVFLAVSVSLDTANSTGVATIDGNEMTPVASESRAATQYETYSYTLPARATEVTIGSSADSKHIRISDITFTIKPGNTTGIEAVEVEATDAAPVYYNLQGVRVANPEAGLYIVRRGNKITKEIVK